jgi:hypothetical protein
MPDSSNKTGLELLPVQSMIKSPLYPQSPSQSLVQGRCMARIYWVK